MKLFFVWRRKGVGAFDVRWSRGVRYFTRSGWYLEGGEKSREDGSERSVGGFRLAREYVSDTCGREDGERMHSVLPKV